YNEPFGVCLTGPLSVEALEYSFNEILHRHEILRTTFPKVNGQPVQVISPVQTLTLSVVDLRSLPETAREAEALRLATEAARRPFSLAEGPLLRATLFRLEKAKHWLLVVTHHIVADHWSIAVFIRELTTLYEAFLAGRPAPLPELPIQYADFAHW